jgi:hypothetical protein
LPNPLEEQSWETDGIQDLLVPLREILTDENGKYCFTATKGLWLVVPEITAEEKKQGFMFQ